MKLPREVWWIAGLTALALGLVLALGGGQAEPREEGLPSRTTYSSAPYGLRALFLTLQALGYDARRWRTPLTAPLPEVGTLVVVEPVQPITASEWRAALRWVQAGHTLLFAGEASLPAAEKPARPRFDVWEEAPLTQARPRQPTYLARGVRALAVRSWTRISAPRNGPERSEDEKAGMPFLARQYPDEGALRAAVGTFSDAKGTVAAYAHEGKGTILLLTSPWSLSNAGIGKADNLIFALNALGPPQAGPVYFDEYHHGYGENLLWRFTPLPLKLALAHLLAGLLVVMYARSRRFGAIIPLERQSRQRSEFLGTMSGLLQRGRATRLALRSAQEAALQRLRAQLGLPPEAEAEAVGRAARKVNAAAGERVEAALRACAQALASAGKVSESRAMTLVRSLDEAMRALRAM